MLRLIFSAAFALSSVNGAVITYNADGANGAAIQATIDQFRADLGGANNGVGGTFATGRREINWDAVPDSFSQPNFLPGNFFNSNSARGVVMTPLNGGTGFFTSADASNPTTTPALFASLGTGYGTEFQTFSAERLFTVLGSNQLQVEFFVPGTLTAAGVSGFGAVFADVDLTGNSSGIQAFDAQGNSIGFNAAIRESSGLSFTGIRVDGATPLISRVVITVGNTALGGSDPDISNGAFDVVVLDDFIYGEPQAAAAAGVPEPSAFALSALGLAVAAFRFRRR